MEEKKPTLEEIEAAYNAASKGSSTPDYGIIKCQECGLVIYIVRGILSIKPCAHLINLLKARQK